MSASREQIRKFVAQGRHQQALNALLDLLGEEQLVHDVHFAARTIGDEIDTASLNLTGDVLLEGITYLPYHSGIGGDHSYGLGTTG